MLEYNMETFGKIPIGIHGQELPKFAERPSTQQYWKIRNDSYVNDPKFNSQKKLWQSKFYWVK